VQGGLLWVTCQAAYQGSRIAEAVALSEKILSEYGFEPRVSLVATHTRHIKLIVSITYERGQVQKDSQAKACQEELLARLILIDCLPFRLDKHSQWASPENALFQQIKATVDPDQLLSPGHYQALYRSE
jgi:hypothetical protein